jgi:hypothetical protein
MVNLVATNANTPAGTYSVAITATPTVTYSGVTVAALTENVTITVGGSMPPSPTGAAGTALAAAGFNTVVFFDDFTTTGTTPTPITGLGSIAPNYSALNGYNWYWATDGFNQNIPTPPPWVVLPTTAASSIATVTSPSFASPMGGVISVSGVAGNSGDTPVLTSIPTTSTTAASGTSNPNPNAYVHGYFECYAQFNAVPPSSAQGFGWPGFWLWSLQNIAGTQSSLDEVDIMEYDYNFGSPGAQTTASTVHQWPANIPERISFPTTDGNWHLYGCLWTGNGTTGHGYAVGGGTSGTLSFYYDNALVGSVPIGNSTSFTSLESIQSAIINLDGVGSTGSAAWANYFDWVRVWQ